MSVVLVEAMSYAEVSAVLNTAEAPLIDRLWSRDSFALRAPRDTLALYGRAGS